MPSHIHNEPVNHMEIIGTAEEIYERHSVPAILARWAPELVGLAGLRAGEHVLDVACGTGIVTRQLPDRVGGRGRVVGLDLWSGALATARVVAPGTPIRWVEGDATKMPLAGGLFDAVICQQGLQFFSDRPVALSEMRRVLVQGGRLVLAVWRSIEQTPGFCVLQETLARRIGPELATLSPFGLSDGQAIRSLVMNAGFRDVRVRAEVKLSRWQSADHFVRNILALSPAIVEALAAQGEGGLDTVVAEVAGKTRSYLDDEGWATPQAANIITALA